MSLLPVIGFPRPRGASLSPCGGSPTRLPVGLPWAGASLGLGLWQGWLGLLWLGLGSILGFGLELAGLRLDLAWIWLDLGLIWLRLDLIWVDLAWIWFGFG